MCMLIVYKISKKEYQKATNAVVPRCTSELNFQMNGSQIAKPSPSVEVTIAG